MKYFAIDGDINQQMLERFTEFYNKGYEKISISLSTDGGDNWIGEVIIDMINNHPDATLIVQRAWSTGMAIAVQSKCKKTITSTCTGMYHYSTRQIWINDLGKPAYGSSIDNMKHLPYKKALSEKFARNIMNKKEFKKFKKDKDVYFGYKRMCEIIKQ